MSKISYAIYIKGRISGFAGDGPRAARRPGSVPIFLQQQASSGGTTITGALQWVVRWRPSHSPLRDNVADLQHAIEHHSPTGRFTIAASPGGDRALSDNDFYPRGTHPWRLWPRPCGRSTMRSSPLPPPMCYVS